jgi:hypothetical protein
METEGSLPHSRGPNTRPYTKQTKDQAIPKVSQQGNVLRLGVASTSMEYNFCQLFATAYSIHPQLPSILDTVPASEI